MSAMPPNAIARARLGDQDALAAQMIARPELRSRVHRFAWLLFLLGPLPMIALMWVPAIIAGAALFEGADRLLDLHLEGTLEVALTRMAFVWVVPGVVGLLLCWLAVRRCVPAIWPLCANAMVALVSSLTHVTGTTRVTGLHFGYWYGTESRRALSHSSCCLAWPTCCCASRSAAEYRPSFRPHSGPPAYNRCARRKQGVVERRQQNGTFIHGGFWQVFDKSANAHFTEGLLKRRICRRQHRS